MLNEEFGTYVPGQWQDGGLVKAVPPESPRAIRTLRKAEKWKTALTLGALAFSVVTSGSMVSQIPFHIPDATAICGAFVGTSAAEHSFVPTTAAFEVSPQYWQKLVHKLKAWRPLPPDDNGTDIEPGI